MGTCVGVVAVQGDVAEHARASAAALGGDIETRAIRSAGEIPRCDGVIIPGGESTTISRLIHETGIADELRDHVAAGKPMLATCAGLIVTSRDAQDERIEPLGLLDVTIDRNAYGGQRESFEAQMRVAGFEDPFRGVFIRAPRVAALGDVEVLATYDGEPVAIRDGPVVGASFHPELTGDPRFHRLALSRTR